MARNLAVAGALALIAVCGIVHGLWADRWQPSPALEEALTRVELVPLEIGDWKAETVAGDAEAFEQAGAQAYWTRWYTNTRKRQTVLAILMCGRAGRMAVHTPEVCYRGAGFELFDKPVATPLRAQEGADLGTFNTARFVKASNLSSPLRLYWSWNAGDGWRAPRSPRWEFRGRQFLYKLYVSHDQAPGNDQDAAAELLQQLLPELRKALYAGDQ